MKQKVLIIALIVSVGINLGILGMFLYSALKRGEIRHPPHKLGEELGLSPEQKEMMGEMRREFGERTKPIKDELALKRAELVQLLKEPEIDPERRDELFVEITELQAKLELLVFDHLYQTKDILTEEQQELFFKHLEGELHPQPPDEHGPPPPGM